MERLSEKEKRIMIGNILTKAREISKVCTNIKIISTEEGGERIKDVDRLDYFLNKNCNKLSKEKSIGLLTKKYKIEKNEANEIYDTWREEYKELKFI